ncbi:MAG: hypothetical protein EXS30_11790 [Pedosphaera sp.]|nr:hypothetical protein [Pedosphaera sp.]
MGVVVWVVWSLLPSDEKVIRTKLSKLATAVSISPDDSTLVRLAKTESLRDFFSPDVDVQFEPEGRAMQHIVGRADLLSGASIARTQLQQANIQLLDIYVKVGPDKESARGYMTLLGDLNKEKNAVSQELKMNLKKIDGDWLITRVETVKTLH